MHPPQNLNFPNNFTDRGKTAAETEPDCPARVLNTPPQRYHLLMHEQTMKPASAHTQRASLESCCNFWMSLFPTPAILAKSCCTGLAGGVLHTAKWPSMKRLAAEAGTPPKPMLSPICCRHGWERRRHVGKGEPGWQKSRCKRMRTSPVTASPVQAKQPSKFGINLCHSLKLIRLLKNAPNYFSIFNVACVAINRLAVCGGSRAGLALIWHRRDPP